MHFEKHLSPQEIEDMLPAPSGEVLDMKADLQKQLIMRTHTSNIDLDQHFREWIDANNLKFRIVFNELRYNNPNLLEEYHEDCPQLVSVIEEKMKILQPEDLKVDPFLEQAA